MGEAERDTPCGIGAPAERLYTKCERQQDTDRLSGAYAKAFSERNVHLSGNHAAVVRPKIECLSDFIGIYAAQKT